MRASSLELLFADVGTLLMLWENMLKPATQKQPVDTNSDADSNPSTGLTPRDATVVCALAGHRMTRIKIILNKKGSLLECQVCGYQISLVIADIYRQAKQVGVPIPMNPTGSRTIIRGYQIDLLQNFSF